MHINASYLNWRWVRVVLLQRFWFDFLMLQVQSVSYGMLQPWHRGISKRMPRHVRVLWFFLQRGKCGCCLFCIVCACYLSYVDSLSFYFLWWYTLMFLTGTLVFNILMLNKVNWWLTLMKIKFPTFFFFFFFFFFAPGGALTNIGDGGSIPLAAAP